MHAIVEGRTTIDIRALRRDGRVPPQAAVVTVTVDGQPFELPLARRTQGQIAGVRLYLRCRYCHRNCDVLFYSRPYRQIACRKCFKLWYHCQTQSGPQRTTNRLCKMKRRLGGPGTASFEPMPNKPARMRWATYWRKIEQIEALEDRHHSQMNGNMMRFLARVGSQSAM